MGRREEEKRRKIGEERGREGGGRKTDRER